MRFNHTLLFHDNVPAHKALLAKAALRDCQLLHPTYSPDLVHCDFHLSPNLNGRLHGKHFEDDNELKIVTEGWLYDRDKSFI